MPSCPGLEVILAFLASVVKMLPLVIIFLLTKCTLDGLPDTVIIFDWVNFFDFGSYTFAVSAARSLCFLWFPLVLTALFLVFPMSVCEGSLPNSNFLFFRKATYREPLDFLLDLFCDIAISKGIKWGFIKLVVLGAV